MSEKILYGGPYSAAYEAGYKQAWKDAGAANDTLAQTKDAYDAGKTAGLIEREKQYETWQKNLGNVTNQAIKIASRQRVDELVRAKLVVEKEVADNAIKAAYLDGLRFGSDQTEKSEEETINAAATAFVAGMGTLLSIYGSRIERFVQRPGGLVGHAYDVTCSCVFMYYTCLNYDLVGAIENQKDGQLHPTLKGTEKMMGQFREAMKEMLDASQPTA